ncbi:MAG: hypothetical protein D4R74_12635 [Betaproteobacteria bacterium]|nr:MAG: hypothetical protein D4R74_12635 [Betaproteobacteria bacterium]
MAPSKSSRKPVAKQRKTAAAEENGTDAATGRKKGLPQPHGFNRNLDRPRIASGDRCEPRAVNTLNHHYRYYRVCGLRIRSSFAFPELRARPDFETDTAADIEFEVGGDVSSWDSGNVVMTWDEPAGTPWLRCTRTSLGYRLHFPGFADFLIDRAGRHVRCVADSGTAPETIRHLFLDQVVPPLLNLRGREALHASAIRTPGGACAFIGASGQGKSTLAAAFHLLGHAVLSDDCLLIKDDADSVQVEPAYAGLRLWDDSRDVLFGNTRSTLPVSQYTSKKRVSTPESNTDEPGFVPLRCIYSLRRHEDPGATNIPLIEPVSMRDAFMELVEFSFRIDLTDQAMILRQMRVLERVAREVPVMRLRLPGGLSALPAACQTILRNLEN